MTNTEKFLEAFGKFLFWGGEGDLYVYLTGTIASASAIFAIANTQSPDCSPALYV